MKVELERVPDPARRHGPGEKLVVNKPNTQYYLPPNFDQAHELFDKLYEARETSGYTRPEKSSKIFK